MTLELERGLNDLKVAGRLRSLAQRSGHDFSSNDFLGLAESPVLRDAVAAALTRGVPVGAGGSRLLRGNHPEHEALEAEAARFFNVECALYFATGFAANTALFATLPQRGDLIVYDALIHASVHDGLRLGRAQATAARHNDAAAVETEIRHWRNGGATGRPWIAVESIYSMDGDVAPLDDLAAIANRHDAMLVIDEAHATGVLGEGGRGLAAHLEGRQNVISLHTCGKALGVSGALVTGPRVIRDFLVNRGRSFVFSTAPSPLMAATVRASLALIAANPSLRERHAQLVTAGNRAFQQCCGIAPSGTHIIPVIVGEDAKAVALAHRLQERGFDVRAIRPPTVPEGTARLRISLTLNVEPSTVEQLARALAAELIEAAA